MNKKISKKIFPIVGIGASAGGLEAFRELLTALPTETGMAFVLVQHLDPTHDSILTTLLAKKTSMPVTEVTDSIHVVPNHVYVIPPNKDLTIRGGILKLSTRSADGKLHLPINRFFCSLAEEHENNAIGIILSGTASDGTLGLKAIKAAGGITFAQNEKTAKYSGMPNAAIASGSVDFVLSPSDIAKELVRISRAPYLRQPETPTDQETEPENEKGLQKLFSLIQNDKGVDFGHYKRATINRRIKRRMLLHKLNTLDEYVQYVKDNKSEIDNLFQEFLIDVTRFFREPTSHQFLTEKVLPRMLEKKSTKEPIRIWVPGCATGEEVYSLAMTLTEFLESKSLHIPIQIFGTDLSQTGLNTARRGFYYQSDLLDVSTLRINRFFIKTEAGYQIIKSVRDMCIFAPHNVFKDPPFSKIDLISCCNLLIYMDSVLQDNIFHSFHYALRPTGYLLLGKSEGVGMTSDLFSQIDKKYKLFMRKDTSSRISVESVSRTPLKDKSSKNDSKIREDIPMKFDLQKVTDSILLSHHTPSSVVIDSDLEIIQFRGSTEKYLSHTDGKASFNLMKMAKGDLWFELRTAIAKAKKSGKPYRKEDIRINRNDAVGSVTVEVDPLNSPEGDAYYLILFESTKPQTISSSDSGTIEDIKAYHNAKFEQELTLAREDMRSITEEQEATNEELQSANEEILSNNEELQSINEELETSTEELESTNEELTTVNEELQNRNAELTEARNYSNAIIRTVQTPLLILDGDLRVRTANRAFYQTFQVDEEGTEGSSVFDLGKGQWSIPSLGTLLMEILPKDNTFDNYEVEHTFPTIGHKIMLLNARKFISDGQNILLAIEDITERKSLDSQKSEFIGIASHELKTPITTMKAFAQILQKRLSKSGNKSDAYILSNINIQADRLTTLINDLLNVSKIEAGRLMLEKKKFDLDALIRKIVVDFQYTSDSHIVTKEGEIKELVYGDEGRIEQLLSNLITNAIKYSPDADKVIVRISRDKQNHIIRVQDFGFGIAKKDQVRIFEQFYRTSDKDKNNVSGFGLGLYISSEIIKRHGGKIWVESTRGKGSTFTFTLPLKKGDN
ncbi:MAG TPA: chemotaxis protein CheB [Xanthomonadales bacterium]|nr:chemotaxis protein CheB [Xanthomonadales bacterium]